MFKASVAESAAAAHASPLRWALEICAAVGCVIELCRARKRAPTHLDEQWAHKRVVPRIDGDRISPACDRVGHAPLRQRSVGGVCLFRQFLEQSIHVLASRMLRVELES